MSDWGTDLDHEKNSVENDEGHDEVLKGGGDDHPPQLVLEAVSFFWHVTFQWLRLSKNVLGKENEMGRQIQMCSIGQILCRIKICSQHLDGEVNARLLIFVNLSILELGLALFLEGDDDESNEDVDEEEGEDDEEDDVEDGHFGAKKGPRSNVLKSGSHRVL